MGMMSILLSGSVGNSFAHVSSQFNSRQSEAEMPEKAVSSSRGAAVDVVLSKQAQAFVEFVSQGVDGSRPSSEEMFSFHDVNSDGSISEEEFVYTRPDFASEEQASAKFAEIDSDGNSSVSAEELESSAGAMSQAAAAGAGAPPPPPPPPPPSDEEDLLNELYDELDTNEDGVIDLSELIAGMAEEAEEAGDTSVMPSALSRAMSMAIEAYSALDAEEITPKTSVAA